MTHSLIYEKSCTAEQGTMVPLLKWAGGKRRLTPFILSHIEGKFDRYFEPFFGGGAMLFSLAPKRAVCSDINSELVNFYRVVQFDLEELIKEIKVNYLPNHSQEFFYARRGLDRNPDVFSIMSPAQRAARFIYLNKTCYNGLWRVNKQGFNNVPWGRRTKVNLWDEENLYKIHKYLLENDIEIIQSDYKETALQAKEGDLVYFDPPYDDENESAFVEYSANGFSRKNQIELRDICNHLVDKGVKVVLSNSNTKFMREIFEDSRYDLFFDIPANRSIGSKADYRQTVNELLVVSK